MGKPAARLTDMHVCPMSDGPKPHVGGPVTSPGTPTVLIGGMPAAGLGDMCTCVGPPDVIVVGSSGVLIGGKPAARMGDSTAHGGTITLGCMTVLIGEAGGGGGGGGGGASTSGLSANATVNVMNKKSLTEAAENGEGIASKTEKDDLKAQFGLIDEAVKGIEDNKYEVETTEGKKYKGKTDSSGKTENISGVTPADCWVTFFDK
jgi:uncharacterized Zn-binding protein involved in type VI secretion